MSVNTMNMSNVTTAVNGAMHADGDIAWITICSILVWFMVPGIGFFYSGMALQRTSLSLITLCIWSLAVVSVQWFLFGYSITFSDSKCPFIGNLRHVALINMDGVNPSNPHVPAIVFCLYQQMLAGITPALVLGAAAERGRFLPTIVFMFLWTTFVYDVIASWTWSNHGWMKTLGVLDFAGGTPIHIAAGAAAIAYAKILGERPTFIKDHRPHNMVQVVMGTSFIWFGWFGFNGGSVEGANARAAMVILVTNLSASVGGITWAVCDYFKDGTRTFSALSFCFGAVAGLVSITPASGYIAPWSAVIFGFVGALICHGAIGLKDVIGVDDALDVAAVHGVCGLVGTILTGVFAQRIEVEKPTGEIEILKGGWVNGNWMQVVYQIAGGMAGLVWALVVTYLILWVMNRIPGLELRLDEKQMKVGMDKVEMGECAYERISDGGNGDNDTK